MITKIGIGVLVGIGLFMILADCFRIPYMRTSKAVNSLAKQQREKTSSLDVWLSSFASFIARKLKYQISALRSKRLKLLHANADQKLIEDLKTLKETLDEYPKTVLQFDEDLFSATVEKIVVGSDGKIDFRLKGGLQLGINLTEVR